MNCGLTWLIISLGHIHARLCTVLEDFIKTDVFHKKELICFDSLLNEGLGDRMGDNNKMSKWNKDFFCEREQCFVLLFKWSFAT